MKRRKSEVVKMVMEMKVEGKRRGGKPKKKWLDAIDSYMETTGVCENDVGDYVKGRLRTRVADPKLLGEKNLSSLVYLPEIVF